MANWTITVSNTMSMGGGGRPTLWGATGATTMTWGSDKWLSESEDFIQDVTHVISKDSVAATSVMVLSTGATIANSLSADSDVTVEFLSSGIWFYVFQGNVTNANNRTVTTYATPTVSTQTYATPSQPSTVWS